MNPATTVEKKADRKKVYNVSVNGLEERRKRIVLYEAEKGASRHRRKKGGL